MPSSPWASRSTVVFGGVARRQADPARSRQHASTSSSPRPAACIDHLSSQRGRHRCASIEYLRPRRGRPDARSRLRPCRCASIATLIPKKRRQTLLFSATMPNADPRDRLGLPDSRTPSRSRSRRWRRPPIEDRPARHLHLAGREAGPAGQDPDASCSRTMAFARTLVFTRTKHGADKRRPNSSRRLRHQRRPRSTATRARASASGRSAAFRDGRSCASSSPPTSPPAASTSRTSRMS